MQTIGDRIWYRISAFVKEEIASRLNEIGFSGGYLDAGHVSGAGSSTFLHTVTNHIAGTLGQLLVAGASGVWATLSGNTTTTRKFLRQTGDGVVSALPVWDTLVDGDIPTTLAGKTLTTPTIADFTNAQHEHTSTASSGGVLTADEHDSYSEYIEIADPTAPAANKARLYVRDNGAGKTQLVVVFPTGAVQILATEP